MAQQIKKKFIGQDQIDGSKIKLLEGQSLRIDTQAGEVELLKLNQDGKLESQGEEIAFKPELASETQARQAADVVLQSNIDAEMTRAMGAESSLQSEIDAEEVRAQAAEQALQSSITQEVSDRQAADVVLQGNIDDLDGYAQEIRSDLDQEISDRVSAVSAEESARIAGDQNLQTQINNILSNVDPAALDSLTEIVTAFQNADSDLQDALTALSTSASSAIAAEQSARIAADQTLQSNIDMEESERIAADQVLQGNIDSEMSRAMGVEGSLQSQITQEVSDRQAADLVLQGNIDSEMSRAMGVESSLQSQITQEISDRIAADNVLDSRLDVLEAFGYDQVIHVSKNGSDSNTGKQHSPFLTITAAMNAILDASPSKRYAIRVAPGNYTESSLALKANVFVVGDGQKESVRITGAVSMGSSFTQPSSFDNRSGFANLTLLSAANFDWNAVQSPAGKLYFSNVVFGSTVNMYGYNNAIAQAQFNACVIFGALTISGINVGVFTDNVCYGNVTLNQHPNGGMATILVATGGYCSGTIRQTTTVNDFNRRCASFLRGFASEVLIVDGLASYADVDLTSQSKQGAQKLNGGNLIALNPKIHHDLETQMIKPLSNNAHNMGDWGKQWMFNFGYVHASSGTDLYVTSVDSSYDPAGSSAGYSVNIEADGYGLKPNINGGDINVKTATPSGSGERGKIKLDGKEIDVSSKQIKNLADGVSSSDAVNKGQLDLVSSTLSSSISQEVSDRIAGDEALDMRLDVLEADPVTKSYVDGEVSDLQTQINNVLSNIDPAALDSLTEIVSAFQGADSNILDAINALSTSSSSALAAEQSARIAADQTLQSNIDVEMSRAMGVESSLQSQITQEISDRQADVDEEMSRAMGVESGLDSRLTIAESDIDSLELRVDETESDISTLQSQVLNLDSDITSLEGRMTTAETDINNLESSLSSEISRATSAENALDARLDVLEAKAFGKETFNISTTLTHVDLSREVVANSLVVFVGRLAVHKDLDFTVSVVGGVTRLTWINSFAQGGEEAVASGDSVFVTYYY